MIMIWLARALSLSPELFRFASLLSLVSIRGPCARARARDSRQSLPAAAERGALQTAAGWLALVHSEPNWPTGRAVYIVFLLLAFVAVFVFAALVASL